MSARHEARCAEAQWREPAEQLGDTTPGALDALPPLEHPAITQARADTRIGPAGLLFLAVVFVAVIAASALVPGVWFAGWTR